MSVLSPLSNTMYPSTPMSQRYEKHVPRYRPLNSSPLAPSPHSPDDSPAQARRKAQYKSKTSSSRTPRTPAASTSKSTGNVFAVHSSGGSIFNSETSPVARPQTWSIPEDPQKKFLRDKFMKRCYQRVAEARAQAIGKRRYMADRSSDGFDLDQDDAMDDDDDEDDEAVMQDELFRRIVANENSRHKNSFRRSYAREVGSSFDPELEDLEEWEQAIKDSSNPPPASTSSDSEIDGLLVDLDDEELQAYADEYASQAAAGEFDDGADDDLFSAEALAQLDALEQAASGGTRQQEEHCDVDMN